MAGLFRWLRRIVFRRTNLEIEVRPRNEIAENRDLVDELSESEDSTEFDPTIPNLRVINTELPDIDESLGFDPYDSAMRPGKPEDTKS